MRILAFVTEQAAVRRVLEHVGESATPAPLSPSRAPPWEEFAWDGGGEGDVDQRTAYADEPWWPARSARGWSPHAECARVDRR